MADFFKDNWWLDKIWKNHIFWKNSLLIGWIVFLGFISTMALGGNFSIIFEALSKYIQTSLLKETDYYSSLIIKPPGKQIEECGINDSDLSSDQVDSYSKKNKELSPTNLLNCYIFEKYEQKFIQEVPPIGAVLDSLQTRSWRDTDKEASINLDEDDYNNLFEIVRLHLIAISLDKLTNVNDLTISNGILPYKFRFSGSAFQVRDIPLPIEAQNWVLSERKHRAELKLVDTFFIVIILGALGSIIFLMREHIDVNPTKKMNWRLYLYRPTFGMLLAIGTFIISISFNGFFSEGKIEDIKVNSVLTLAFAAGLLSDLTYEYLKKVSNKSFDDKDHTAVANGKKQEFTAHVGSDGVLSINTTELQDTDVKVTLVVKSSDSSSEGGVQVTEMAGKVTGDLNVPSSNISNN